MNATYALCLKTLANDLRLQTLKELEKKPLSVQQLSELLHEEQSAVSHSLQQLRTCNYVEVQVVGKQRIYSLRKEVRDGLKGAEQGLNLFHFLDHHREVCCNNACAKLAAK